MIVIALGYSGTGSSSILHLLSEYSDCSKGIINKPYEHLPFYTPHGLFDLEDALLKNNNIHRSDAAISDFYKAMKRLNDNDFGWFGGYKKISGNQFMNIVDEFIEELTEFTIPGGWSYDYELRFSFIKLLKDSIKIILRKPIYSFARKGHISGDGIVRYSFVTEEQFYKSARKFVNGYLKIINPNEDKILVLDQILLPHNLHRLHNYFDEENVRCIVFDRDPRDMYILSKYVWPRINVAQITPIEINEFIEFYTRLHQIERKVESKSILRLNFEDLVYNYELTVKKIEKFIGLDEKKHIKYREIFNPEISIKNTQNFRINNEWENEVKIIEDKLKEYLFDFPYKIKPDINETSDPQ